MENNMSLVAGYAKFFDINFSPKIAIVLGTRLSRFIEYIEDAQYVNFSDIEGFPEATTSSYNRKFVTGYIHNVPVIVSDGRFHYYEGYDAKEIVMPIRLMNYLGANFLIETNISGAINGDFNVGDIMLINDHISSFVPSPLVGIKSNDRKMRFVDMHDSYDKVLSTLVKKSASKLCTNFKEGVYAQLSGPNYETLAEVNMLRILGADCVGMSTACEVVAARQLNMRTCGISYISNIAGMSMDAETRKEVLKIGAKKSNTIFNLIIDVIKMMKDEALL